MSDNQSAAFPGGHRGGACSGFGLGGPFHNRGVDVSSVLGWKRQRMEVHEGLAGSCSRSNFTSPGICAPGVLCIGPPDVSTISSPEISCMSPGHALQAGIASQIKGKVVPPTCASQDLLVHVPCAPLEVTIPIYVVREQMCRCLHLQEYSRGVFHDDDGTSTAWVKMDVPPSTTNPETNQKTFYGEPSPLQVDAYRTLDEAVVRYLCEECGVVVKDVNYERVRRLEYSLFRAATYGERLYGMVDELKREVAVVEAERDRLAVSDSHYATLFSAGRMVTARFADILPLATLVVDGLAGASNTTSVMYIGSRPPGTRVEQLATFLENFMNRGPSIAGAMAPPV